MIPLRDTRTSDTIPFVNYSLITLNLIVFFLQFVVFDFSVFIQLYGFTPALFSLFDVHSLVTLFTSMFMHAGVLHLVGNMWFLHIFGDNVEGRMGHVRYLVFYLVCGLAATGTQYAINTLSSVPMLGASGAIAGVTGAYFVMFRNSRIEALVPSLVGFWHRVKLPAWIFLGYWFAFQLVSGFGSLALVQAQSGSVAFFAHIGGFVAGTILAGVFGRS